MKLIVETGQPYQVGRLVGPNKLEFGGLVVEHMNGNKFRLYTPHRPQEYAYIDEADITDTVKFILRHFKPWNDDMIQSTTALSKLALSALENLRKRDLDAVEKALSLLLTGLSSPGGHGG